MNRKTNLSTPEQLEAELKKRIIGQDGYLHDLSFAIWLHNQRREHYLQTKQRISKPKYNMLVIGKSGMGKTSAIQAAAELLDIPLVIEDASELRGAGWKGKHVADIVLDIRASVRAERRDIDYSIVVLDEIDKVFEERSTDQSFSPVNNLLKFIEGMEVSFTEDNERNQMKTDNMLFICIGAFDGLGEIIEKRLAPKTIGFSTPGTGAELPEQDILKEVTPKDLVEYGVNEQFLGRLPFVTVMNELTDEDYKGILLESEISPVKELDALMQSQQGVAVTISPKAAEVLAEHIRESELGARALQGEVINLLKDKMYRLPQNCACNEYRLDYDGGFVVRELEGPREIACEEKPMPFHLSREERRQFRNVMLDDVREDNADIWLHTEMIFERFEAKDYLDSTTDGLADLYDYMTIKQAQMLMSAAIKHMLMNIRNGVTKTPNMSSLLHIICCIVPDKEENFFLKRLEDISRERTLEIREIAWTVAHKYAIWLYNMGADMPNDDELCD
jgi:ATP-dependent Clp protease ATP-binding subunit ClpX